MHSRSGIKNRLIVAAATVLSVAGAAIAGEPTDALKARIDRVLVALVERLRSKETDAAASPATPRRPRRD